MSKYRIVKRTLGNGKVVYVVQSKATVFPFIKVWQDDRTTDDLKTAKWVVACNIEATQARLIVKEEIVS